MADPSALEQFRQQWQQEVKARAQRGSQPSAPNNTVDGTSDISRPSKVRPPSHHPAADFKDDDVDAEEEPDQQVNDLSSQVSKLKVGQTEDDDFQPKADHEPQTALEHYERAVEKEIEGRLGDSVSHYRKAYRLDSQVDRTYKDKHFAAAWKSQKPGASKLQKPGDTSAPSSSALPTRPTASAAPTAQPSDAPLSFPDLITSYAGLGIPQAEPVIKGDQPPPCPINNVPSEILDEIYTHLAILDPAMFTRLALVCKRFAHDVFRSKSVWKRVSLGREFGIASQYYDFACDVQGHQIRTLDFREPQSENVIRAVENNQQDWREFFHHHPRIRFNGVYISTVNYTRAGQGTTTSVVWNTPVHIVTYYRYLRFFRDGTVISLLTTHDPADVIHHLTKPNMDLVRLHPKEHGITSAIAAGPTIAGTAPAPYIPPTAHSLMKHALRGRWRLCHPSTDLECDDIALNKNAEEGDLHIETEGVGPRYLYTMHLSLKSTSRTKTTTKNNKLQWKGFWSFNHITNDWAEFQLRNDRAFVFSRVRSYGMGY